MFRRSKSLLIGAAAYLALPAFYSTAAVAHTYERCDADGDHCVRVSCDKDGDECWRKSEYYKNEIYRRPGRWVCDSDGDRCRYEYAGRKSDSREDHDHDPHN
jgi:hypothetical protein